MHTGTRVKDTTAEGTYKGTRTDKQTETDVIHTRDPDRGPGDKHRLRDGTSLVRTERDKT